MTLATFLRYTGRVPEAAGAYREGFARLAPDSTNVHLLLSNVMRASGDLSGAVDGLREALRLKPDDARAAGSARSNPAGFSIRPSRWPRANASPP